jgi:hypothetical protein
VLSSLVARTMRAGEYPNPSVFETSFKSKIQDTLHQGRMSMRRKLRISHYSQQVTRKYHVNS